MRLKKGHQLGTVKHPHEHSHHGISHNQGHTSAVTPASNRSANHSNNNISKTIFDSDDTNMSRTGVKSPDCTSFSDVYSNCYSSLRSLHNTVDSNHNKAKTETKGLNNTFLAEMSKSNESIGSTTKMSKPPITKEPFNDNDYSWNRSTSYKDLYREENLATESKDLKSLPQNLNAFYDNDLTHRYDIDFYGNRQNGARKNNYATTNKSSPPNRTKEITKDTQIYSNNYPITTSSLSTESAEEERFIEVLDMKYDSQEEMVLSHDDISHDSYELLERDPNDYESELMRNKSRRVESDRARSCSWGSDRGLSPINFRSTDNVLGISDMKSRDNGFWTLGRERSPKHKSEADFRSLDRKSTKRPEAYDDNEHHMSMMPICKRGKQKDSNVEDNEVSTSGVLSAQDLIDREYLRLFNREGWSHGPRVGDFDQGFMGPPERSKYHIRKKSLEKFEPFLIKVDREEKFSKEKQYDRRRFEKKRDRKEKEERFHEGLKEKEEREWERERERRQLERKKNLEEKMLREEKEMTRTSMAEHNDYSDFKEIHFKKFDRVVSNQFGKYSEFLTQDDKYDLLLEERKVMENYEKVCEVGKMAKEIEKIGENLFPKQFYNGSSVKDADEFEGLQEATLSQADRTLERRDESYLGSAISKAAVERTKSDPYNSKGNLRRNVLMHQKSIDLTPSQSEDATDYSFEDSKLRKSSRSEHDILYILHKRHMDGEENFTTLKTDIKGCESAKKREQNAEISGWTSLPGDTDPLYEEIISKPNTSEDRRRVPSAVFTESTPSSKNLDETKKSDRTAAAAPLYAKPPIGKKPIPSDSQKGPKNVTHKQEYHESSGVTNEPPLNFIEASTNKITRQKEEPIYAEVYKGKITDDTTDKNLPPDPPERTSSMQHKCYKVNKSPEPEKKTVGSQKTISLDPSKRAGVQKSKIRTPQNDQEVPKSKVTNEEKVGVGIEGPPSSHSKSGPPSTHRRKESLILFARTRLGMSEGSAFTLVNQKTSPASQRRTKSLDAPYISLHRLPPVDAFSSKDDTVESNEGDVLPVAERVIDSLKRDANTLSSDKSLEFSKVLQVAPPASFISDSDTSLQPGNVTDLEADIKSWTENQPKFELTFTEEKVLDGIRSKRLLSKIESVDGIDSEGDMDSSKLTDALPIPSDRLVNLPESVRFPSARQISGQTSEESADGWEQKEVKVKRRTPRRSVGRDEGDDDIKESVVWDSKDDELPDEEVWDDNLVFTGQHDSSTTNETVAPIEYLKRGSCGQSIDDDNLSTPMKESSPEHWVSVDDLPEAIEREEKLLRQQEKILREKIFHEKLKRELNLDTIDVDEKYYDYRSCSYEAEPVDMKGKFKGHSLDTYELTEKRLRERGTSKHCSLDEHILRDKPIKNYITIPSNFNDQSSESLVSESLRSFPNQENVEYIQCKVLNDLTEIDQFTVDNDEELEEFFVVLDEKSENDKDLKNIIWETDETLKRSLSKEESVISVPEEFRDDDDDVDDKIQEIPLPEKWTQDLGGELIDSRHHEGETDQMFQCQISNESSRMSSHEGSRRNSLDKKKLPALDTDRLSLYDSSYQRNSNDPQRLSGSEEPDRLSPSIGSRRGSQEPRRLSSEDSRKYSISESVSEETRRRLSSTEETRRKRASLTKQCSVGAESLSDEMITGAPECNSSFEHDDERDVFEVESKCQVPDEEVTYVNLQALKVEMEHENLRDRESVKEPDGQSEIIDANKESMNTQEAEREETNKEHTEVVSEDTEDENNRHCEPPFIKVQKPQGKSVNATSNIRVPDVLPLDDGHRKPTKVSILTNKFNPVINKNSFDSSQESDIDKLSEVSIISHVQNQIARRNLSDAGKCCKLYELDATDNIISPNDEGLSSKTSSDEQALVFITKSSSDELKRIESSSFEGKSDESGNGRRESDKILSLKLGTEGKCDSRFLSAREKRTPEQEKRDSGEDGSSSSSAPPLPRRELSSTWKPFLLESSGSSSLEENWLPPDDSAHLADEEETTSTSNNQQDESGHDDVEYPTGVGYPAMTNAEMIVGGYGGVYALSRTLSRISERSTSEQERSDVEDDFTKRSSHSVSAGEESMLSSDRQPSLSSDPPSLRGSAARIPDLPDDQSFSSDNMGSGEDKKTVSEPFGGVVPPPLPEDNWPSPISSAYETVGVSHIETVYLEIYPEEARKVIVAEPQANEENSSSDENQTLHEEGEFFHLSSDNISISTTTTTNTQDGTVIGPLSRRSVRTASISEDASILSVSERSSSTGTKSRTNSNFAVGDEFSEWSKCSALKSSNGKGHFLANEESPSYSCGKDEGQRYETPITRTVESSSSSKKCETSFQSPKLPPKVKPPKLKSPTGKIGFFETPVSKVRSPASQTKFFESDEGPTGGTLKSPTCRSESSSPKKSTRFFDSPVHKVLSLYEASDTRSSRSPVKGESKGRKSGQSVQQHRSTCTPYYSNVAEGAEKSFFGRYDTGSLERTKIIYSRKCRSFYSMAKTVPDEDSSNSDEHKVASSNTIPRASKKTKKRHRVAMDLEIRDGRIVAPPKTRATVIENTDSDRSSPREFSPKGGRKKRMSDV